MSWLPFRKQPKKPTSELEADNEFYSQVEKFNQVEVNTRKMCKDMKRYIEDNTIMMKAQQRLGQDLITNTSNLESDENINEVAENIQRAIQTQADLQVELNSNLRKTFVDPMKKFSVNFNTVNSAIKRREQSLQDYVKYLNRREKFIEKDNQPQSGKFDANERYLALAKADFERRNTKLLEELPKFYSCRMTYFEPCFEGLVKSQHTYFKNSRDVFEELSVKTDCPTEQWSDTQYADETKKRLAEIRSLSIVAEKEVK